MSTVAEQARQQGQAWKRHRRGCGPCTVREWCATGSIMIAELERLVTLAMGNAVKAAMTKNV